MDRFWRTFGRVLGEQSLQTGEGPVERFWSRGSTTERQLEESCKTGEQSWSLGKRLGIRGDCDSGDTVQS